ncbi:MAG: TRAP transporter large permease subunit [Gammaproteobacteria bacterium AqS3]|nr:TRAP transporter large permease subunit [Gammaproteobacteria bacterium AqS3]
MAELLPLLLFVCICATLLAGYPAAFTLGGVSLIVALLASLFGAFNLGLLGAIPLRVYGIVTNETLIAVPLFVLMGVVLEKSAIAERLLNNMAQLFGARPGGMALAVVLVGTLLAASTGIIGATVVAMGLLSLPAMLQRGYSPGFATGLISATGTLGQIIPPSIALILLGDVMANAHQSAQLSQGMLSPETISVGDLFVVAFIPGMLLVAGYAIYSIAHLHLHPPQPQTPAVPDAGAGVDAGAGGRADWGDVLRSTAAPLLLIAIVLGSIFAGIATPTEAAGLGACGALLLAAQAGRISLDMLGETVRDAAHITSMVFMILIGASIFSLVFRGLGGDDQVAHLFDWIGSPLGALLLVMAVVFVLGFILDFIEITFMVVPIVAPLLLTMGFDPLWLAVMIALNLQTSFLTPPFGFALFYLRGVAPPEVVTVDMYRGVLPFIAIQLGVLLMVGLWPLLD